MPSVSIGDARGYCESRAPLHLGAAVRERNHHCVALDRTLDLIVPDDLSARFIAARQADDRLDMRRCHWRLDDDYAIRA